MDISLHTDACNTAGEALNRNIAVIMILIVLVFGVVFILYSELGSQISSVSPELSNQCPSNQYSYNESLGGVLKCSHVGYNQLTGAPTINNETSSQCTSANQYAYNESSNGILKCNTIAQDYRIGLVAYYPLETSVNIFGFHTVFDISSYGNNGLPKSTTGYPQLVIGQFSNALNFSSNLKQNITITNSPENNFTSAQSFTISLWVNPTTKVQNASFIAKVNGIVMNYAMYFVATGGKVYFTMSDGINFKKTNTLAALTTGTWYYLVGVYSSKSDIATLYENGVFQGNSSNTVLGTITSSTSVSIGGTGSGELVYSNSKIDEVRIYNFAMTQTEVTNQYNFYENILNGV